MSTTRLLILGAVRIFEPVHGYFVRRELLSWRADQWAHINPGSIYNALRTLTREGFLEEVPGNAQADARGRTSYRLTPGGRTELTTLLYEALWNVEGREGTELMAAVGFMNQLPRVEVLAALELRISRGELLRSEVEARVRGMTADATVPAHTTEVLQLADARLAGELQWCAGLCQRIRDGAYIFHGEPGWEATATAAGARAAAGGQS
jgi:DNA-binding PadR family transcriptional regulator